MRASCGDFRYSSALFEHRRYSMALSLFDVSIPVLVRGLTNLSAIIDKAAAHAEAKKLDPAGTRAGALVSGHVSAHPSGADHVRHRQGCRRAPRRRRAFRSTRITRPLSRSSSSASPRRWTSSRASRRVSSKARRRARSSSKVPNRTLNFTGLSYLNHFVLPNFYFHESMRLRHPAAQRRRGR